MATSSRTYGPMFISGGWVLNGDYNVTTFDVQWLEETLRRLIQDQLESRQLLSLPDGNPLFETALRQSGDEYDSGYLLDRYFEMSVSHQRSASGSTTPSMQVSSLRASSVCDGASFMSAVEYQPRGRGTRGVLPLTTQIQIFVKGVPGRRSLLIPVNLDDRIIEVENRIRRGRDVPKFDFRLSHRGRRLDEFDTVRGIGLKALSTLTCGSIMVRSPQLSIALDCIEIVKDDGGWTSNLENAGMQQQFRPILHVIEPPFRTGCVTCEARRVKCDEKKPICDGCVALGKACFYRLEDSILHLNLLHVVEGKIHYFGYGIVAILPDFTPSSGSSISH